MDSETRSGGQVVARETRYFACSLGPDEVTAAGLLRLIRGHWQVENGLHHIKDRWWDEDRHYTRQDRVGEGMAALRNAALSILRAAPVFDPEEPIKARADRLARKIGRVIDLASRTIS